MANAAFDAIRFGERGPILAGSGSNQVTLEGGLRINAASYGNPAVAGIVFGLRDDPSDGDDPKISRDVAGALTLDVTGQRLNFSIGGVVKWFVETNGSLITTPGNQVQLGNNSRFYSPNDGSGDIIFDRSDSSDGFRMSSANPFIIIMKESTNNPGAGALTSGGNAKDRLGFMMKNDKLVFAYNNAGTVTYITIPLDGATTTWTHGTGSP